jgi:prevent-host-death family protein
MRYSTRIKPISYLKANAADVLNDLREVREPLIITQNGEAKAVLQDVTSYEETQETLALLKLLAKGQQDVVEGRLTPLDEAMAHVRAGLTKV